nr:hypothetical protein GCM10020092_012580 [Actinoplanes digitatis]
MGDPGINVETGGLNKFATDVRADTDYVTEPAVGRAKLPLDSVPFGAQNASGGVHAAKERYAKSLSASTANLGNFLTAARLLAAAAEKVAADFDAVDAELGRRDEAGRARTVDGRAGGPRRPARGRAGRPSAPRGRGDRGMSEPVLTSSWCTAWGSFNTPRLWSMVMNEDDPDAWRQVAAWGQLAGAVKDQRSLLLNAREALVAAWPPGENTSSAAFVKEIDTLLARMEQARADADDTATGLANILEALRQAKNDIEPLWEQYKEKSDDLVPAWWDNAEDDLDRQARQHMITAEQIVQDNVARLKVPDPYLLDPKDPMWEPTVEPGDTTSSTGGGVSPSGGGGTVVPVPHDPVPPLPGRDPFVPGAAPGRLPRPAARTSVAWSADPGWPGSSPRRPPRRRSPRPPSPRPASFPRPASAAAPSCPRPARSSAPASAGSAARPACAAASRTRAAFLRARAASAAVAAA